MFVIQFLKQTKMLKETIIVCWQHIQLSWRVLHLMMFLVMQP